MLIPELSVCDGVIDCDDLSDECLCEGKKISICDKVIKFGEKVKLFYNPYTPAGTIHYTLIDSRNNSLNESTKRILPSSREQCKDISRCSKWRLYKYQRRRNRSDSIVALYPFLTRALLESKAKLLIFSSLVFRCKIYLTLRMKKTMQISSQRENRWSHFQATVLRFPLYWMNHYIHAKLD